MHEHEMTELMNICMIYDDEGNVLMQNRRKKVWPGVTFPGGHVEPGESLVLSVIREVKEETGLDIRNVKLCGVKEWFDNGVRSMVFFYKNKLFFRRTAVFRRRRSFLGTNERDFQVKAGERFS